MAEEYMTERQDERFDDGYVRTRRALAKGRREPDPGGWLNEKWPSWLKKVRRSRINQPVVDLEHTAVPNPHPAWYDPWCFALDNEFVEWLARTDDAGGLLPDGRLRDPLRNIQYKFEVDTPPCMIRMRGNGRQDEVRAMVIAAGSLRRREWSQILQAFEHGCAYCGKRRVAMTLDHITAVTMGGQHEWVNAVPACKSCNSSKNNNDLVEWLDRKGEKFALGAMARMRDGYDRLREIRRQQG